MFHFSSFGSESCDDILFTEIKSNSLFKNFLEFSRFLKRIFPFRDKSRSRSRSESKGRDSRSRSKSVEKNGDRSGDENTKEEDGDD